MERRPPKHFKPQTTQQRLAVLRRIDEVESHVSSDLMMLQARTYMQSGFQPPAPEAEQPAKKHTAKLWRLPVRRAAVGVVLFVVAVTFNVFFP